MLGSGAATPPPPSTPPVAARPSSTASATTAAVADSTSRVVVTPLAREGRIWGGGGGEGGGGALGSSPINTIAQSTLHPETAAGVGVTADFTVASASRSAVLPSSPLSPHLGAQQRISSEEGEQRMQEPPRVPSPLLYEQPLQPQQEQQRYEQQHPSHHTSSSSFSSSSTSSSEVDGAYYLLEPWEIERIVDTGETTETGGGGVVVVVVRSSMLDKIQIALSVHGFPHTHLFPRSWRPFEGPGQHR